MNRAAVCAAIASVLLLAAGAFAWRPADSTVVPAAAGGPDGATLFRVKGCATCHTGPDSRPLLEGLPDLSDAATWAGQRREGLDAAAYIRESIQEPAAFVVDGFRPQGPLTGMPALTVSDAEVDALVAYLLGR